MVRALEIKWETSGIILYGRVSGFGLECSGCVNIALIQERRA